MTPLTLPNCGQFILSIQFINLTCLSSDRLDYCKLNLKQLWLSWFFCHDLCFVVFPVVYFSLLHSETKNHASQACTHFYPASPLPPSLPLTPTLPPAPTANFNLTERNNKRDLTCILFLINQKMYFCLIYFWSLVEIFPRSEKEQSPYGIYFWCNYRWILPKGSLELFTSQSVITFQKGHAFKILQDTNNLP